MTIRSSINARHINTEFQLFEIGCQEAPLDTFDQAKDIGQMIGEQCDTFLQAARDMGLNVDNCDGIREIECLMFDMIRKQNPDCQIEQAIGLGKALHMVRAHLRLVNDHYVLVSPHWRGDPAIGIRSTSYEAGRQNSRWRD